MNHYSKYLSCEHELWCSNNMELYPEDLFKFPFKMNALLKGTKLLRVLFQEKCLWSVSHQWVTSHIPPACAPVDKVVPGKMKQICDMFPRITHQGGVWRHSLTTGTLLWRARCSGVTGNMVRMTSLRSSTSDVIRLLVKQAKSSFIKLSWL